MIFIPYSQGVCDPELALAEMGVEMAEMGCGEHTPVQPPQLSWGDSLHGFLESVHAAAGGGVGGCVVNRDSHFLTGS